MCTDTEVNQMSDRHGNDKDDSKFPDIPEIPEEIIYALDEGKLIVFIGAGLSALFGLPDWKTMATKMLENIHREKNSYHIQVKNY